MNRSGEFETRNSLRLSWISWICFDKSTPVWESCSSMESKVSILDSDLLSSRKADKVISATSSFDSMPEVKKTLLKTNPFFGLFFKSTKNSCVNLALIFYLLDFNSGPKQAVATNAAYLVLIDSSAAETLIKGRSTFSHFLWVLFSRLEKAENKYPQNKLCSLLDPLKTAIYLPF